MSEAAPAAGDGAADNLVLTASAGTGKTHTLVDLYLALVLGAPFRPPDAPPGFRPVGGTPVPPREILLATFTRNAAAELRARVRGGIEARFVQALSRAEDETVRQLARLREEIETAPITTLDAFCHRVVQDHALEIGVRPGFDQLDEVEAESLLREVTHDACKRGLNGAGGALLRRAFCGHRIDARGPRDGADSASTAVGAIAAAVHRLLALGLDWSTPESLLPPAREDEAIAHLRAACEQLDALAQSRPSLPKRAAALRAQLGALLDRDRAEAGPESRAALLAACEGAGWQWGGQTPEVTAAKKAIKPRIETAACILIEAELRPAAGALARLLQAVVEEYEARQIAQGGHSFALVQRLAVRWLERTAPGRPRPLFRWIIVDEAQDLSGMQARLLRALWHRGLNSLALCGDAKQSIYGWRDADPRILRELAAEVTDGGCGQQVPLRRSYRANARLVEFINDFFSQVGFGAWRAPGPGAAPDPGPTYLDYDGPDGPHWLGIGLAAAGEAALVEAWSDDRPPPAPAPAPGATRRRGASSDPQRAREMQAVARRIRLLVAAGEGASPWKPATGWDPARQAFGPNLGRPYRYRDILILLRRTNHQGSLEDALRAEGIPFSVGGRGRGFFARQELKDIWHWVRAVADPHDGVALAGVLRSPVAGLADEAIHALGRSASGAAREEARGGPAELARIFLTERPDAECLARLGTDAERDHLVRIHARLRRDRLLADLLTPAQVVEQLVQDCALDAVVVGAFNGEQRLANLKKLLSWTRAWSQRRGGTLAAFAAHLGDAIEREQPEPDAAIVDPDRDAVTIMTVHSAKGLTAPVVIVPDLHGGTTSRVGWLWVDGGRPAGSGAGAAPHAARLGLKLRRRWEDRDAVPLFGHEAMAAAEGVRAAAELRNLLYVALTRARDLLVVVDAGLAPDATPRGESWHAAWELYREEPRPDLVREGTLEELFGAVPDPSPPVVAARAGTEAASPGPVRAAPALRRLVTTATLLNRLARARRGAVDPAAFLAEWWAGARAVPAPRQPGAAGEDVATDDDPAGAGGWKGDPAGAELGSACHAVLEQVALIPDAAGLAAAAVATAAYRSARAPLQRALGAVLSAPFTSWLARELGTASEVRREWPFVLRLDEPGWQLGIRGSVDAVYSRARSGPWRLIDYKIVGDTEAARPSDYRLQLMIYALALRAHGVELEPNATLVFVSAGAFRVEPVEVGPPALEEARREALETAAILRHLQRGEIGAAIAPP